MEVRRAAGRDAADSGRQGVTLVVPNAAPATAAPPGAAVVWHFDPWREAPRTAVLASLAALSLGALVVAARLPFVLASALCVACVASFSPALTPVECRLDEEGAARRGLLGWERRAWKDVRRVIDVPGGVRLSPFATPNPLEATRALLLPMPRARRDALRAEIARLREAHRG